MCPKVHQNCEYGEIPPSGSENIVFTNSHEWTEGRTDRKTRNIMP